MDYSNLVSAVQQEDEDQATSILNSIFPRLLRFLHIHMNACKQDAEDCAQEALLNTVEAIKDDKIRDKDRILSFLLTACRNNYLNLVHQKNKRNFSDFSDEYHQKPRQLSVILDDERRQKLDWCIQNLSEAYQTFINYWFTFPDSDTKAASAHFGITAENVWTRKHRIIKKLQTCLKK